MAVHVEDHPLDYFDFEGVIPAGEYGGGDVIVWDWGTWELADGDDPIAAVEAGDLHFDLDGEKLRGRFVLVRRGAQGDARSSGCCSTSTTTHAVDGWDPEDHPRSVKTGRTNDEVKAAPAATLVEQRTLGRARRADELAALDALGQGGQWQLGEHTLKLTNLDKVLFPAAATAPGGDQARPDPPLRHDGAGDPALPRRPAGQPAPLPRRHRQAGLLAQGRARRTPPTGSRRWRNDDADPGETELYLVLDSPAALAWAANFGAIELHPWTSTVRRTRTNRRGR